MKKRYFWGIEGGYLWRFRNKNERFLWFVSRQMPTNNLIEYVGASHPEVRRINRMIQAGEVVNFPVRIGE